MNGRIFIFLAFSYVVCLSAQDVLSYEHSSLDEWSLYEPCNGALLSSGDDKQNIQWPDCLTNNVQYGWSELGSHNAIHQSHSGSQPSYSQQALIASMCQSWTMQDFAREIELSINQCMACGYSRQQAETCILEQHALYVFPNFITNVQQFSRYRSYIKELRQKLLHNQGKFYRLRKALRSVNRGYLQLLEITEQLHNEIITQEKVDKAQSRSVPSRDKNTRQQESTFNKQEAVRNTFDAQHNILSHEFDEWHVLQEIYQEEQIGDTTRIERRIQALKAINDGQLLYTEQSYALSTAAVALLHNVDGDSAAYTTNYGNQLQQVIHQECIEGIEHVAAMRSSNTLYPYRQGIAQCFDAAHEYNQEGLTNEAATVSDFCWTLLDCGLAIAQGAVDGVIGAVKDMAEHPAQTAICAIAGEYVLAYQLSKVLYHVADIGITALSDSDKAWKKWDEYTAPVTQLIDAITNQQLTLRDTLRGATQLAVQWKTQDRLFKGLNSICTMAKAKAIEYAKNNPLSMPQEYVATPEGFLFKSMSDVPPSGSSLKYERSSRFFVSNHAEITALTKYAQKAMQPPREILQVIGRDFINVPEGFLKHIFAAELKVKSFLAGKVKKSLSGFHHFMPEHLTTMGIQLINARTCKKTGVIIADVLCDGHLERKKTFFPSSWTRDEVVKKLGEAIKNQVKPWVIEGERAVLLGATSEGIIIRMVIDLRLGEYITAYPDLHANGLL